MKLYLTTATYPHVDKSGLKWKVTPLVLEFTPAGATEDEVDRVRELLHDAFMECHTYDIYDLIAFLQKRAIVEL